MGYPVWERYVPNSVSAGGGPQTSLCLAGRLPGRARSKPVRRSGSPPTPSAPLPGGGPQARTPALHVQQGGLGPGYGPVPRRPHLRDGANPAPRSGLQEGKRGPRRSTSHVRDLPVPAGDDRTGTVTPALCSDLGVPLDRKQRQVGSPAVPPRPGVLSRRHRKGTVNPPLACWATKDSDPARVLSREGTPRVKVRHQLGLPFPHRARPGDWLGSSGRSV